MATCRGGALQGGPSPEGGQRACSLPAPLADKSKLPGHPLCLGPQGTPRAGALGDTQTELSLDQVLQERDEAIAKKRAVEAELDTCKAKLQAVEAQLLEVLQEKLRLRQEVEAWEEDMQQLVRQQVERQLQRESAGSVRAPGNSGAARAPWYQLPLGRWW